MQLTSLTYANRNLEEALGQALEKLKGPPRCCNPMEY
jgi:hypothetical protein